MNMKKSYIIPVLVAGLLLSGCSIEDQFEGGPKGHGRVLKSALDVTLNTDENVRLTRTGNSDVSLDDFDVVFTQNGGAEAARYKYADMPDVVLLPAGSYTCTASYGENKLHAWNSPYYFGESNGFSVTANAITSSIDPIECKLGNVKVTVTIDNFLEQNLDENAYVNVKVGANDGLDFTREKISNGDAGYFQYSQELTLVATFFGKLNGQDVSTTKSYKNIMSGSHYKLNFRLHDGDDGVSGGSHTSVVIDTNVSLDNKNQGLDADDEPIVVDPTEHPSEGDGENPGPVNPPVDPDNPDVSAPTVEGEAPLDLDNVNVMQGDGSDICILTVKSSAEGGIVEFTCDIESPNLTAEELASVGLSSHLDLVNPGELQGALEGLGLPVNVGGMKDVEMNITSFIPLLAVFGPNEHTFKIMVKDANGTTEKSLRIKFN